MADLRAPTLDEIRAAHERIRPFVMRTPLLKLELDGGRAPVYLKPENLQSIGSFKIRGAGNAMARLTPEALAKGVYTPSAGNMAQGVAWNARRLGVACDVIVPDHAPQAKLTAIERLGGRVTKVPFERWWQVFEERSYPGMSGRFIHPVADVDVMAGNGTIGLEIAEDLPDVATVLVPYGGGGLSCGIASALRGVAPKARVIACEVETAAPLGASLAAGRAMSVDYRASFVDGIGGKAVLEDMWPLSSSLLASAMSVSLEEIAAAIRALVTRVRLVAEGAGASSVAAAMSGRVTAGTNGQHAEGPIVCVISGGNLDPSKLATILEGRIP